MKIPTPHRQRLLAGLSLLAPVLAVAQSAPKPGATAKTPEDVVVLSPFSVDATTDQGYRATSTLAGSRIKTDLKDVAASVSVLTSDFLDDLGANDIASAMAFVAGAENDSTYHQESIAGLGSANGYVGGDFGDNNNRSGEIRVRGLGRATNTVNFIEVLGSTDRYNTERTEFLRGANSILFGLAEPAGLVNSSTKVANLRKDSAKVELKVDHFGSNRVMLDVNKVLLDKKLAFRIVGLNNDQQYEVETAYLHDKRLFGTATYQPFKGTTVRAYVEGTSSYGRRPNFRTVQDNVSQWLKAYNTYAPRMTAAQIDAAFFWDPLVPNADGLAPATTFTLADGMAVNLGRIRRPLDTSPTGTYLIYSGNGQWSNPLDNRVTLVANRGINGAVATPATIRSQFARTGDSRENNDLNNGQRADPQVTDKGIFPYDKVEIQALPGAYRKEHDRKYHVTLDQRITDDLYFSATFQHEIRTHEQYFPTLTQTNQISVDINKNLPDGRVNPNFLRPFISGRSNGEASDLTYTNYLLQANYDFDFAKKTTRLGWLGSHRLGSVYTRAKQDRLTYRFQAAYDTDIPNVLPAATNAVGSIQRSALQLWYVGDPVKLGDTALRFTGFPDTLAVHFDRSYDYQFYNDQATPKAWQFSPTKLHVGRSLINNAAARSYSIQRNEGLGTSLQSFFWKNRIVTLVGWRQDTVESFLAALRPANEFPFPDLPGDERGDFLRTGTNYKYSKNTTTQSIVFKLTDRLRVLANRSQNFAATNPRQDNLFRPIAPQSGKTDEVGFGVNLFRDKLDVKVSHFKSSQLLASNSTGVAGLRVVAFEGTLYDALVNARRLGEWSTVGVNGPSTSRYETPNNATSTEDDVSKGYTLEIGYQPNRNWDFVASVDKLENVATHVGSEISDFLAVRAPFYKKYFNEGLRADGSTNANPTTSTLVRDTFINTIAANFVNELLKEGVSNRGFSPITAKLVGRYKFTEGGFRGLSIGTNLRWESGKIIGYGQTKGIFNFGGLENYSGDIPDLNKEYRTNPILAGGMVLNYSRKIYRDRVRWKIQFNAQNLFSKTGLRPVATNADGSPIWAVAPPRAYELTNTFEF